YRGGFDNIDLLIQSHAMDFEGDKNCFVSTNCNGFISKMVTFIGKAAHAGIAPQDGINALNMAHLALGNIHAQRETFKEADRVRVSAIVRDGGDIVNVVPSKVTMEALVRGASLEAMLDANKKTNRSLQAAALALGGEVIIEDGIGYLPLETDRNLDAVVRGAVVELMGGTDQSIIEEYITAGATDLGDISHVKPCTHIWMGGIQGGLHTQGYNVEDEYAAYVLPAKILALSVIDLLYDKAPIAKEVIANFKPKLSKEQYLDLMQSHSSTYHFDYTEHN
ncbi:MAG: peptidase dimerization domain-containing protein, partial [Oscillospiraceae bacterium]